MSVLTTEVVHRGARFAYWRQLVRDNIVALDLETPDSPLGFSGTLQSNSLGPLRLTLVRANSRRVAHRRPAHIVRGRLNRFSLDLPLAGSMRLDHCGHQTTIRPGAMVLIDSDRPYAAECSSDQTMLSMSVGADLLHRHIAAPEDLCGRAIDATTGLASVLAGMLVELQRQADTIAPEDAAVAAEVLLDLFARAMRSRLEPAPGDAASRHLRRAKDLIVARLGEPDLAVEEVAHELGISARYLRRIFAAEGTTPSAFILESRLQRCRTALADPAQAGLGISRIAMGWGFGDASQFSRAFRRRFGTTPSAARAAARAG